MADRSPPGIETLRQYRNRVRAVKRYNLTVTRFGGIKIKTPTDRAKLGTPVPLLPA